MGMGSGDGGVRAASASTAVRSLPLPLPLLLLVTLTILKGILIVVVIELAVVHAARPRPLGGYELLKHYWVLDMVLVAFAENLPSAVACIIDLYDAVFVPCIFTY